MPVLKLHDARKLFAAAVMVAFLATTISVIAINKAGQRAIEAPSPACQVGDLGMLSLEQGKSPVSVDNPKKALCVLAGLKEELYADDVFLLSYSALNLAFFLFLAATMRFRAAVQWALIGVGLFLAVTMLCADFRENQIFLQWIHQAQGALATAPAGSLPSGPAIEATQIKWSALAVASALLGLIYLLNPSRMAKLVALPALGSAAILVASLSEGSPHFVFTGRLAALGFLWLAILVHAVIVAIEPPPVGMPQAAGQGERNV
ncbi:MAG TPA: hypothetical protein VLX28_21835 [Thermoanaerobaculia bacterium]|nr:hypothetical protein [Thermoanaerobaculia bacterium]